MASDAVGSELISRIVGYKITKGNYSDSSPNLPRRIAILAEANTANQASVDFDQAFEFTSAQQVGRKFGYGSPAHLIARILRPASGGSIGGIPTFIYPQETPGGAAAKAMTITPTGTATANGTHNLVIAGRKVIDGKSYAINIVEGDTPTLICNKIVDAINNALSAPITANNTSPVTAVVCTSKWKGLTADELTITIDNNDADLGVSYGIVSTASGSGTPTVTNALNAFGNEWITEVINSYGTQTDVMDELEAFNGIPDPNNPTGRYAGIIMKPFIALTGSVADNPSTITDARPDDVTIAICPAPLSPAFHFEAAANMCTLFSRVMQDNPHRDVNNMAYPDMPMATSPFNMMEYTNRDNYVKKGCSTVDNVAGVYRVQDFVTTYHPEGEEPPQFRYCRNLGGVDFNVRYTYYLQEQINVVDKTIANDNDIVTVSGVVKPKIWKQVWGASLEDLGRRGLIADVPFSLSSLTVGLSTVNPDRLETFFRYKRTGVARIAATTAEAGFNFGQV